jgi:uncharacterized protein (DUF1778 family)
MKSKRKQITVRVTEEEHDLITKKADDLGLTISEYLRLVAMKSEVKITVEEREFHL